MRKVRRLAAVVVMTVAAVAIGLWLLRDQPRRIVQAALAERLDADVSLGSLHVDGLSAVRLGELDIRVHGAPGLQEIRIAEVIALGDLRDLAGGRFESLRLVGVEVVVDPARGAVWPTVVGPQATPEVARLEIAAGRVTMRSPDGDSVVDFSEDRFHVSHCEVLSSGVISSGPVRAPGRNGHGAQSPPVHPIRFRTSQCDTYHSGAVPPSGVR
jgi:hypothetical protein